jgi:polar amino acid transport system ATP-binding protein
MKLQLQSVVKDFGSHRVLDRIDLDVDSGEVVALIGASGSGKSTLLRCVNLLEHIDDGRILLDGQDISEPGLDADPIRRRIGMVFQSFNLFPHLTVAENIALAPRKVQGRAKAQAEATAVELLLDEITSALDPELVGEVLDVVRGLRRAGMTMLFATHEMSFAREISDRVYFLEGGRIVESGPPERIFGTPSEERTRRFLQRVIEAGRM